ncbi:MAG: hypothetical protein ACRC9X_07370 [Bacteroidales bacterium]
MKAIQRLYQYLEVKDIKPTHFEKKNAFSSGYLSKQYKRLADIGESIIVKITENCPDLSLEWLITGKGSMLRSSEEFIEVAEAVAVYGKLAQSSDGLLRVIDRMQNQMDRQASIIEELSKKIPATPAYTPTNVKPTNRKVG